MFCGSAPCNVGFGPTPSQAELGAPSGRHWAPVKRQVKRKRHTALFISAGFGQGAYIATSGAVHRRGHGPAHHDDVTLIALR